MKEKYDVIIIGSGIAGMTAGIYLKRGGLDVLIIEENAPGGQLNKINTIENYPGFAKVDGPTLAAEIFSQVRNLDIEYLFDRVISVDRLLSKLGYSKCLDSEKNVKKFSLFGKKK